jgi:hypothetical protein
LNQRFYYLGFVLIRENTALALAIGKQHATRYQQPENRSNKPSDEHLAHSYLLGITKKPNADAIKRAPCETESG